MNTLKTTLLLTLLTLLMIAVGGALGGQGGMVIAFVFALIMNGISYWFSDKIVLRMYRAQEIGREQAPELYRIVHELAAETGIPMPRLYIIPEQAPNAFATGRSPKHAAVAVTQGILKLLNESELRAVLAHELSHVKNRDVLVSTVAAVLAGAISMIANMAQWGMIFGGRNNDQRGGNLFVTLAMIIVAPLAALLIQMAISRRREYGADETGAHISRAPLALASALRKLQRGTEAIPMDANPATAHLFIVNPLHGGGLAKLFSTHPPLEDRIRRLQEIAATSSGQQ